MQNEQPPFMPFNPGATAPAPQTMPAQVIENGPAPRKPRKASGKKTAPRKASPKKPTVQQAVTATTAVIAAATPKRNRRKAAAKPAKRAPKFELQTILKVAGTLKEADQKLFEKMLETLTALPKASRTRILSALGQVFA